MLVDRLVVALVQVVRGDGLDSRFDFNAKANCLYFAIVVGW